MEIYNRVQVGRENLYEFNTVDAQSSIFNVTDKSGF